MVLHLSVFCKEKTHMCPCFFTSFCKYLRFEKKKRIRLTEAAINAIMAPVVIKAPAILMGL